MEDAKTIRYVSKDPIQNLKIRVTLWRLSVQKSKATLNNPGAVNQVRSVRNRGQSLARALLHSSPTASYPTFTTRLMPSHRPRQLLRLLCSRSRRRPCSSNTRCSNSNS